MKHISMIAAALALAAPALAQPAQPAEDTIQTLSMDWSVQATANKHVLDGINKLVVEKQALAAENAKLKKELEEATAKLAPSAADKK